MKMRQTALWLTGMAAVVIASPTIAKGIDCPTARQSYSSASVVADIAADRSALAIVRKIAPQSLLVMGKDFGLTKPIGFGRILSPAKILEADPDRARLTSALDRALAPLKISRATMLRRCWAYDEVPPTLKATIGHPAVLVFDKITGFRDEPSVQAAKAALDKMAARRGWTIVYSDNGAVFNKRDLARFDVVVWNNVSGDALTVPQREAFRRWIESGGGYAGFHGSAGDPVYLWPWYVDTLVGARFIGHPGRPQFQPAKVRVSTSSNAIVAGLTDWTMTEEWYSFGTNPRATGADILLTLDESTYAPVGYRGESVAMGADHPLAWTRCVGHGRAFYSAIGHRPESYDEPNSLAVLERGIVWAMKGNAACAGNDRTRP